MSTEENVMQSRSTPSPFRTYHLPDVLYSNLRLILNMHDRIATMVDDANGISAQACLSAQVWAVTLALLDAHPAPCPQAVLYATFAGVELYAAQEILKAPFDAGVLDVALRYGLGEALAACQAKLALFNLGIQPVPEEEGYRLFLWCKRKDKRGTVWTAPLRTDSEEREVLQISVISC